jgi:hypothetical protein
MKINTPKTSLSVLQKAINKLDNQPVFIYASPGIAGIAGEAFLEICDGNLEANLKLFDTPQGKNIKELLQITNLNFSLAGKIHVEEGEIVDLDIKHIDVLQ